MKYESWSQPWHDGTTYGKRNDQWQGQHRLRRDVRLKPRTVTMGSQLVAGQVATTLTHTHTTCLPTHTTAALAPLERPRQVGVCDVHCDDRKTMACALREHSIIAFS